MKSVEVYNFNKFAGVLTETAEGAYQFQYDKNYVESDEPAISYSLPKRLEIYESRSLHGFFDGLIPEGWLLKISSEHWKLNPLRDRFTLLTKICHDPIGSVSIGVGKKIVTTEKRVSLEVKPRINKSKKCYSCYQEVDESQFYHSTCAKNFFGDQDFPRVDLDEAILEELVKNSLENGITGAQKKVALDFDQGDTKSRRLTLTNYAGRYILKPRANIPHIPENEHLCLKLALICGIEVVPSVLIPMNNGDLAFITRRLDRVYTSHEIYKIAMEDFCQILDELTLAKYKGSFEKIGKKINEICAANAPKEQLLRLFELVVFSYIIGNSDLHLKNISIIHDPRARLSPAYDLLSFDIYQEDFPENDPDQMALAINARKAKLRKQDFDHLAESYKIKPKVRDFLYRKFKGKTKEMNQCIDDSFLDLKKKELLKELIAERLGLFDEAI